MDHAPAKKTRISSFASLGKFYFNGTTGLCRFEIPVRSAPPGSWIAGISHLATNLSVRDIQNKLKNLRPGTIPKSVDLTALALYLKAGLNYAERLKKLPIKSRKMIKDKEIMEELRHMTSEEIYKATAGHSVVQGIRDSNPNRSLAITEYSDANRAFAGGNELFKKGKYREATAAYAKAIKHAKKSQTTARKYLTGLKLRSKIMLAENER